MAHQLLENIPNLHRLVPQVPHPAYDLFSGKLLEPAGVMQEGDAVKVNAPSILLNFRGECEILASVITVTYVGLGELPKNWLHNTFRVRRAVVRRALGWLKAFNPKYYGHIKIDDGRIQALPEDDVPLAITSVIRQSTDTGIIDQESDGYVPRHEESEVEVGIVPTSE
ncbi:hypothetical protein B0H14DRAFT_2603094 [Mycena olivaceomarginata]|nr:hypothetical protein B0H14DRAFT_2603094 [Mycena olivaceomarginata]